MSKQRRFDFGQEPNRKRMTEIYQRRRVYEDIRQRLKIFYTDLCSVQPMTSPAGLIFTIKPRYVSDVDPENFQLTPPPGPVGGPLKAVTLPVSPQ